MSAEVSTFDVLDPPPHVCFDGKFPHIGISATVVTLASGTYIGQGRY